MATLTCYGAGDELGGNKILLEDGQRRVLFDFGKAFGRYADFFDGVFIKERVGRGLLDLLAPGLPPPFRDLRREEAPPVDLVLLSHAHQDHIGALEYVAAEVPAASTAITAFI